MSRIKNSIINLIVAMFGQGLGLIVSFISRIFFVRILGTEYLGINGLFSNILTMLSLVELGIGPAIVFSLYKPLSENNTNKVQALMHLYKKAYTIIGITIAVLGICITPFLHLLIKEMPNVPNIRLIFVLFVINSSISYFYAYKRNLIIADQHRYIATVYRYAFYSILNILQIIFLYMTRSYLIFLILQITSTIFENIAVARHADKMYPYLREKNNEKLDYDTVAEIKKNTGAMVLHKMGGIVVGSTDNILISIKVGIEWVGLYSNYQLIISALNTVIGQLFTAITASVGNLGAIETKEKSLNIFECINFAGFWVFGVCSISLYYLINPFIEIWLGIDLLMSMNVVTILVTNFFIQGMRKSVLTFREAFGLYWYDRHKPLFESIINLISSVLLAKKFGITGIFIGTLISTLTTCFWIEPYVLYKKGFDSPLKPYFVKYTIYVAATMIAWLLTGLGINIIKGATIFSFIFKTIICLSIPNLLYTILFSRTKEFNYFWKLVKNIYNKVFKKY